MNFIKYIVLIFVFFFFVSKPESKDNETNVINKTLAKVGHVILTSRQVALANHLKNAQNVTSSEDNLKTLDVNSNNTMELALETAIALDAESFQIAKVEPHEIKDLLMQMENILQKNKEWKNLEVTQKELEAHLERKIKVQKYLKFKSKSLVSIITDQDLRSYYDKNTSKLGHADFENVKENIHSYLLKIKNEEQIRSWLEVIKKKYKVQVY